MATPPAIKPEDSTSISGFLLSFCQCMATGEIQKAVSMWETPALVISGEDVRVLASRNEVEGFFASAKDYYNTEGAAGTRPDISSIHWATDAIAIVEVRWPHLDEESNELGAEMWTYVLRRAEKSEWKIRVGILHGPVTNWESDPKG